MKPLTKDKGCVDLVNCVQRRLYFEKDVLSALALAKKKIKELMLNKFGYTKCEESLKILDECFDIQGQDAKGSDKTQKGNCLKTVDTVSSNKDSTQVRKSTNPSSQVPARCSRLETHNFPNLLNKTKCKWCGKTIKELIGSDKN